MKLITELNEDVNIVEEVIDESTGKKSVFIEGIFMQGGIKNRNGRMYRVETLQKEVDRYNRDYIAKGRGVGELGHPNGPTINLDRVSHKIIKLERQGDNFIGKAMITSTPMGDVARGLLSDGVQLGVSSRGMGSIKANNEGINEVQDDFYLATPADIVADPSAPEAFVNGIMEGVDWVWDHGTLVAKRLEDVKEELQKSARSRELNEAAVLKAWKKGLLILSNS